MPNPGCHSVAKTALILLFLASLGLSPALAGAGSPAGGTGGGQVAATPISIPRTMDRAAQPGASQVSATPITIPRPMDRGVQPQAGQVSATPISIPRTMDRPAPGGGGLSQPAR